MPHTHEYDYEHDQQIALAMAGVGIALAETLIELDKTGQALGTVRQKAEKMRQYLLILDDATEARLIFGSFAQSLHDEKFFPPPARSADGRCFRCWACSRSSSGPSFRNESVPG
jgi:hypothetical protein